MCSPFHRRVLVLSPYGNEIESIIRITGDKAVASPRFMTGDWDWIVSYGHKEIFPPPVVERYSIINLHISYLPWNRGCSPNVWSWVDETPKGVTIHHVDRGLDTGDIIAQREVRFSENETLATSYDKLCREMVELFRETWPEIRSGQSTRCAQQGVGSYHCAADLKTLKLPYGWETPVSQITEVSDFPV